MNTPQNNWQEKNNTLTKEFTFKNFLAAMEFVNQVAKKAEALQHHPDISIHGYNKVTISTSTHDAGTVTEKDHTLAQAIDELL